MKNFFTLKILDLFKGIYTKFGIDYNTMRLILQVKLTLDSRRTSNTVDNNKEVKEKNYFYNSLIIYAILGVMYIPMLFMNIDVRLKMTMYFSCFMILLLTILISDFSSVILDINDKDIIGIRGIDNKTLNAAKTTHIFIYIFTLSLSLCGFSMIVFLRFGIKNFLLFLLSIALIDILMIAITSILYLIILKLFKGEKLKDMLNTFQIGFLLIFTIGYQFIIRSFDYMNIDFVYNSSWWNVFFIPMYFASNFKLIQGNDIDTMTVILSTLSIIVPILSLLIYKRLVPVFEESLQKLNDNYYKVKVKKDPLRFKISKYICKDKEERAIFNFVYNVLEKDRTFKTKVYPSLALGTFMPLIMIFTSYDNSGIFNYLSEIKGSYLFLSGYFAVVIMQNIVLMVGYSNEYEGAWIYDILPIKNKRNIYTGMFKSSLVKLFLPSFVLLSVIFAFIFGISVIKHMIVLLLSGILVSMATFKLNEKSIPFSKPYNVANSSKNMFVVFKAMFITLILVGIHFGICTTKQSIFIYGYSLLLVGLIILLWNKVFTVK